MTWRGYIIVVVGGMLAFCHDISTTKPSDTEFRSLKLQMDKSLHDLQRGRPVRRSVWA